MPLEAVLLDIGDTLLTEEPPRARIYAEEARERGLAVEDQEMGRLMRLAHHGLPERREGAYRYSDPWFEAFIERIYVAELGLEAAELPALTQVLFERFEDPGTFQLYAGARELLDGVRALGLRLGVVSNWSARLPRLLRAPELDDAFDFVLSSALEELEKPDPALFARALERAGSAPERTLHAGDHPEKDGAAQQLGLQFVLVDHRGRHPDSPHERVENLGALLELVRGRAA